MGATQLQMGRALGTVAGWVRKSVAAGGFARLLAPGGITAVAQAPRPVAGVAEAQVAD